MKNPYLLRRTNPRALYRRRPQSFALVIVLLCLVLITVLIISFLSAVSSEYSSAKIYASGESTRQLSDSAVQMVMAQVVDATKGYEMNSDGVTPNTGAPLAWASQPGMIRTYDYTGNLYKLYKLYSSGTMSSTTAPTATTIAADVPSAWSSEPSLYTDLNQPVLVPDPNGTIVPDATKPNDKFTAHYPIVNPLAQASGTLTYTNTTGVEGFSIFGTNLAGGSITGYSGTYPPSSTYNPAASAAANPAPMPVEWLYELADGTIVAPTSASGNTVTVAAATSSNPIVGRIAFWTDDETCKVNINTAAEGTFWDTPRVNNQQDRESEPGNVAANYVPGYARSQPFQHEWQRYPGHPAMTALSTVLFPGQDLTSVTNATSQTNRETLYNTIVPRVQGGGSYGGSLANPYVTETSATNSILAIQADSDRLYTSVDELLLQPFTNSATPTVRPQNPLITPTSLELDRFFLTANSKAPEVNLFNQPRIGIWPIYNNITGNTGMNTNYYSGFDRMIAQCSTLGPATNNNLYYIQRQASTNSTYDYVSIPRNQTLYGYLQNLTSANVPGFGGNFLTKYPVPAGGTASDRDQILTEIFDYIRSANQYDDALPVTNATASSWGTSDTIYQYTAKRYLDTTGTTNTESLDPGHSQVTPIQIGNTMGFGRYTTVSEASIAFKCMVDPIAMYAMTADPIDPNNDPGGAYSTNAPYLETGVGTNTAPMVRYNNPIRYISPTDVGDINGDGVTNAADVYAPLTNSALNYRFVQAAFFLETFCPSMGYFAIRPNMHIRINGLNGFTLNGQPMGFPASTVIGCYRLASANYGTVGGGSVAIWPPVGNPYDTRGTGGLNSPRWYYFASNQGQAASPSIYSDGLGLGLVSSKIKIYPLTSGTMAFSGGPITIEIHQGSYLGQFGSSGSASADATDVAGILAASAATPLIQTIHITFPSGTFPIPSMTQTGTPSLNIIDSASNSRIAMPRRFWWRWNQDPTGDNTTTASPLLKGPLDITVSDIPGGSGTSSGDFCGTSYNPGYAHAYPSVAPSLGMLTNYQGSSALFRTDMMTGSTNRYDRDVVRSMVVAQNDPRLIACQTNVPATAFAPHPDYTNTSIMFAHALMDTDNDHYGADLNGPNGSNPNNTLSGLPIGSLDGTTNNGGYNFHRMTDTPMPMQPAWISRGDWDNGFGWERDGAYINKPDDGELYYYTTSGNAVNCPYFYADQSQVMGGPSYYSPNRKMPSPGMFGSLPTGVMANVPFQTLLFRPDLNFTAGYHHPGAGTSATPINSVVDSGPPYTTPPDHLVLDLFNMPVVEPYAISEPFSTAGKINMNYQIMPFSYITRSTGVRAVLKNEMVMAIPNSAAVDYKWSTTTPGAPTPVNQENTSSLNAYSHNGNLRYRINLDETIKGFAARFNNNDIFRSASEICELPLVPAISTDPNASYANMEAGNFWPNYKLTGDNTRERPYTDIYPRLTTKSNTFTVHVRVQTLKKNPGTDPTQWVEGADQILSEYRGSTIIERYIDADNTSLPDFAADNVKGTPDDIDNYYQFRVVNTKRFNP